jgi:hypothetical protein
MKLTKGQATLRPVAIPGLCAFSSLIQHSKTANLLLFSLMTVICWWTLSIQFLLPAGGDPVLDL